MSDGGSFEEVSKMFLGEVAGFERMISEVPGDIDSLGTAEIVRCYYQVMNMSSMIKALKPQSTGQGRADMLRQITGVEKQIREKFDHGIHPAIMSQMAESVSRQTAFLRGSKRAGRRAGKVTGDEAGLFEKLREAMSTKEFVEQYDKELGP